MGGGWGGGGLEASMLLSSARGDVCPRESFFARAAEAESQSEGIKSSLLLLIDVMYVSWLGMDHVRRRIARASYCVIVLSLSGCEFSTREQKWK